MLVTGALAASAVMFVRAGIIVALFGPSLLDRLAAPLAAAAVVTIAAALAFGASLSRSADEVAATVYQNPFELKAVLGFAALLAVILFLSKALTTLLGGQGGIVLAAIAGLADVDAITLSMTEIAGSATGPVFAAVAILVAVGSNSLSKSALALAIGGKRFGLRYLGVSVAALAAGGLVALAEPWV
jgi:uncharacterized membrane protein (DUF4010 family)